MIPRRSRFAVPSARRARLFLVAGALWCSLVAAGPQSNQVRIGVLAHRGSEVCLKSWGPTARYLSAKLPRYQFAIVPLTIDNISETVAKGEVDFVLTNPGSYVELEIRHGIARMLTLRNLERDSVLTEFGSVIFARAERADLKTLQDLRGRSVAAVSRDGLGGFQMVWRELKEAGIDPFRDLSPLSFTGQPQDRVVMAVRDRQVDAGIVRTGVLEEMAQEGKIRLEDFRVVAPRYVNRFPLMVSTRLYPEWAFARLKHTSDPLSQLVAIALLELPAEHEAAQASQSAGWTVPLDYTPLHDLYKELAIGPYTGFGEMTTADVLRRYLSWVIGAVVLVAVLTWAMFYFVALSRRLRSSEQRLRDLTRRLEQSNENLQQLSAVDGLTGTANRRAFDDTLAHEWARAGRTGQPLALVLVDIDLFKKHNDTYGHQAGDECLKRVADALKHCARRPADQVARYGGEEFVVLLPGADINGAGAVAERMRASVAAIKLPHVGNSAGPDITISLGVAAAVPNSALSAQMLVSAADEALYRAKAVGRNQVILATE